MPLTNKEILAIDDAASIRTFLRISLQAQGANFHEAATAAQGLELAQEIHPDLIILDLGLPDRDGLEILPEIMERASNGKRPSIVVLTVRKEQPTKERARELGADAYLTKPFLMEELLEVMHEQLESVPNA